MPSVWNFVVATASEHSLSLLYEYPKSPMSFSNTGHSKPLGIWRLRSQPPPSQDEGFLDSHISSERQSRVDGRLGGLADLYTHSTNHAPPLLGAPRTPCTKNRGFEKGIHSTNLKAASNCHDATIILIESSLSPIAHTVSSPNASGAQGFRERCR